MLFIFLSQCQAIIEKSAEDADKLIEDVDLHILIHDDYGESRILFLSVTAKSFTCQCGEEQKSNVKTWSQKSNVIAWIQYSSCQPLH